MAPKDGPASLLEQFWWDTAHVDFPIFSLCIADDGGRFVLGGWNQSYHQGTIEWIDNLYCLGKLLSGNVRIYKAITHILFRQAFLRFLVVLVGRQDNSNKINCLIAGLWWSW